MKKFLALGLLASIMSLAQAQVTVYGVVDGGVQRFNNGTTSVTRAADGLFATNRLGFRGREDLGNGMHASFQLEAQLTPSNGAVGSPTVAANEFFNREAWVGIGSRTLGELRFGRTDMTNGSEMDTLIWQAGNFSLHSTNGSGIELGTDQKSTVKWISPRTQGFQLQLARANNANGAVADAGNTQNGVSLDYVKGPFKAGVGHHTQAGVGVARRTATSWAVGYDFKVAALGVAYVTGDNSTTADVTSTAGIASVKVPVSPGWNLHGAYAWTKNGAVAVGNQGRGYTAMITRDLSRRTNLYAAWSRVDNDAGSRMGMPGVTAPAVAGLDTSSFGVGVAHRF